MAFLIVLGSSSTATAGFEITLTIGIALLVTHQSSHQSRNQQPDPVVEKPASLNDR
jgi:hypothetical protein